MVVVAVLEFKVTMVEEADAKILVPVALVKAICGKTDAMRVEVATKYAAVGVEVLVYLVPSKAMMPKPTPEEFVPPLKTGSVPVTSAVRDA